MNEIIQYLKTHGERLDAEIAQAVGVSLVVARQQLLALASKHEIMFYQSTKYEKGKKIEGMRCRISGFVPPAAPGRKSAKVQLKLS